MKGENEMITKILVLIGHDCNSKCLKVTAKTEFEVRGIATVLASHTSNIAVWFLVDIEDMLSADSVTIDNLKEHL